MLLAPKMRFIYFFSYLTIFLLSLSSCVTIKDTKISQLIRSNKCYQPTDYVYTSQDMPNTSDLFRLDQSEMRSKMTSESLFVASTLGLSEVLGEYYLLKQQSSLPNLEQRIRLLELRQLIYNKINNASLAISAVSSELDCEEERISQIASYLSDKQSNLESNLTIGAIVLGASGAILTSGVIKNDKASNTVAISVGVAEAGLGLAMLFNKRKIVIKHRRNILKDIWEGPETSVKFPAFIWYYLNYETLGQPSLRNEIIDKWAQFGQINQANQDFAMLYFNEGGKYTSSELENRADMYDQLGSQIYLLKQKLMTLTKEIDQL